MIMNITSYQEFYFNHNDFSQSIQSFEVRYYIIFIFQLIHMIGLRTGKLRIPLRFRKVIQRTPASKPLFFIEMVCCEYQKGCATAIHPVHNIMIKRPFTFIDIYGYRNSMPFRIDLPSDVL